MSILLFNNIIFILIFVYIGFLLILLVFKTTRKHRFCVFLFFFCVFLKIMCVISYNVNSVIVFLRFFMPKYDGDSRYKNELTLKEQMFCQFHVLENLPMADAYKKAYPEAMRFNPVVLGSKLQKITSKARVLERIEELKEVVKARNQNEGEKILNIKNNPRDYLLNCFVDFTRRCKADDDKSNEIKGLESIAKLLNLYNDTGTITNNQLNQIIISSTDVTSAIESIHRLINKQN